MSRGKPKGINLDEKYYDEGWRAGKEGKPYDMSHLHPMNIMARLAWGWGWKAATGNYHPSPAEGG